MKKIAVLLTVHNRKEKTLNCLHNLFSQIIPSDFVVDVYMTDDGCTDGTVKSVSCKYPQVNILKGDGTLFWNRGMHLAWKKASVTYNYDYYLWLNDDTLLLPNSLSEIISESNIIPDSVIIGSTCSSYDKKQLTYGGIINGKRIYPNGNLQKCETFNGNIVLIPDSIFKTIGNLDWIYTHAIGDLDYGWRVTKAGMFNYVSKEFRGICDNNPSLPKWMRKDIPFKERWNNYHSL